MTVGWSASSGRTIALGEHLSRVEGAGEALMMQGVITMAILLVSQFEGGFRGREDNVIRSIGRELNVPSILVGVPEDHI